MRRTRLLIMALIAIFVISSCATAAEEIDQEYDADKIGITDDIGGFSAKWVWT